MSNPLSKAPIREFKWYAVSRAEAWNGRGIVGSFGELAAKSYIIQTQSLVHEQSLQSMAFHSPIVAERNNEFR